MIPQFQPQGMARNTLHGWHQFSWFWPTIRHTLFWIMAAHGQLDQKRQLKGSRNMRCIVALRHSFALTTSPSCSPTLRRRFVTKLILSIFRQRLRVLPKLDVHETGNVPIFLSLPQMKNLGMIVQLDPNGDKISCPAFDLYSSPAEYSTIGHIVLDLTSLAYHPKSRERFDHPKGHLTFPKQKSAYPPDKRELDENDDDKSFVRPDRAIVSEDEDDEPLVKPSSRTSSFKEKREFAAECSIPTSLRRRKGPPVWRDPSATQEQDVSRNSRERSEEVSILSRNPDGETIRNIINKLFDERKLRDLHLKHNHMFTAQCKKRTTHLDIPAKIYDFDKNVVQNMPMLWCNEAETWKITRERITSGEIWRCCFSIPWINKNWRHFLGSWSFWMDRLQIWQQIHVRVFPHQKSFHEWMDTFRMNPKVICADMAFHHPRDMQPFYRMHNVKRLPTGPHTPWPNRAEMGVRLFKKFLFAVKQGRWRTPK